MGRIALLGLELNFPQCNILLETQPEPIHA